MTNEEKKRIEDFINTHRVYPKEYRGKRDNKILQDMGLSHRYDAKTNSISRLEGRINDNGDFEVVGLVTFSPDNPTEKTPGGLPFLHKKAVKRYNEAVKELGYGDRMIVPGSDTENWTLRDMVAEIDYIRSLYVYDGPKKILKQTETLRYNTELARLYGFLRKYRDLIGGIDAYTTHNSKYDN